MTPKIAAVTTITAGLGWFPARGMADQSLVNFTASVNTVSDLKGGSVCLKRKHAMTEVNA